MEDKKCEECGCTIESGTFCDECKQWIKDDLDIEVVAKEYNDLTNDAKVIDKKLADLKSKIELFVDKGDTLLAGSYVIARKGYITGVKDWQALANYYYNRLKQAGIDEEQPAKKIVDFTKESERERFSLKLDYDNLEVPF